jgi:hypothetical protein
MVLLLMRTARPGLLALFALLAMSAHAFASPLLRCALTYAGSTQMLDATPTQDPYAVASVDVAGRFRFKAVVVGAGAMPDYIKTYVYLATSGGPVLVLQGSYYPPFAADAQGPLNGEPQGQLRGHPLSGKQFVYAGPVERELQYECRLWGVKP